MMAAFEAGRRGRRVLLLEHGDKPGRKILISGGGRCNFTNLGARPENFLSDNPHFARSALARYTPADFIALVQRHGIAYHEKTLGQLFCDGSARQIVTLLERECGEAGVEIVCGVTLSEVRQPTHQPGGSASPPRFLLATSLGDIACDALVIATGGLSIPKLGATGFGYDIARQFGHAIVEPRPGLVPLVLSPADCANWCDLSGVSAETIASAPAAPLTRRGPAPQFREKLLITHRGLSGPAVLQISSFWRPGNELTFDLAPGRDVFAALLEKNARRDAPSALAALRSVLPARLAERWLALALADRTDWTNAGIARLEARLHAWTVRPDGTEGFAKAEVTTGGIDSNQLDARTMESRRVPGLCFIGEVVDVTGWLGGYNFQWAWASATACGRSL